MTAHVCAVLALVALATTHAFVDEAVDVLLLSKHIGEEVLNSWDIIGKPFNASQGVELPFIHKRERQLFSRLSYITRAIQNLEVDVEKSRVVAMLLEKNIGRGPRLELKLNEMSDLLSRVDSADRQMREYVRLQRELERRTLEEFASWCVAHDRGALPGLLERVHALVVPPHAHLLGHSLLDLIVSDLQVCTVCEIVPGLNKFVYYKLEVTSLEATGPLQFIQVKLMTSYVRPLQHKFKKYMKCIK
ncbi:unnamed protein product [Pieris brassicae]|uniref:Uncharacterized protein n=1 Tax=Pieris brassicae TaxID=7116 RepID=A0A9P0TA23_PIEBR|nr:unnamed protein product [Pieris brassicae]